MESVSQLDADLNHACADKGFCILACEVGIMARHIWDIPLAAELQQTHVCRFLQARPSPPSLLLSREWSKTQSDRGLTIDTSRVEYPSATNYWTRQNFVAVLLPSHLPSKPRSETYRNFWHCVCLCFLHRIYLLIFLCLGKYGGDKTITIPSCRQRIHGYLPTHHAYSWHCESESVAGTQAGHHGCFLDRYSVCSCIQENS